jgi:hypothetical protein
LLLALLMAAVAVARPVAAQTPIAAVTIDIDGNQFTLAPADADAFQRRLNRPPKLEDPPPAAAPSYTVTTDYWNPAVREEADDLAVDAEAEYFPAGGYIRARQDGEDVWLVLDLRQRAILDHYILYGTQQRLPQNPSLREAALHPSALLIVFLAYYGVGEPIAIETGDRRLSADEADAFLASVAPFLLNATFLDPPQPPAAETDGYWVTFTLPEGRALTYFLDTSAGTLTDALGTEVHDISSAAGGGIPESADVLAVQQEGPVGSRLWWLLAVGGGVALLVAAFWLQRWSADRG